jgi:hypothetical protein
LTDDNSNAPQGENLVDMDDLDAFSKVMFSAAPDLDDDEPATEVEDEEDPEIEDDALATEDDDAEEEDSEEEDDEEEEEVEEPKPEKKSKKSVQDRINELTAKAREAERREAALLKRLNDLETREPEDNTPQPKPKAVSQELPADAPKPDALGEDGEPLYPFGEFDPKFIRDLTIYTIEHETAALKQKEAQEAQRRQVEAAQAEIKNKWVDKVAEAEKELPDLREKLEDLTDTFQGIDPNLGEFLAATIMSCDNGPQIMYYLSQNIDEAQKIVSSGAASATLAIGRLDAFVAKKPEEKRTKKVSVAPKPPEARTRGSGSRSSVADDTDDLDAFEKKFFAKK